MIRFPEVLPVLLVILFSMAIAGCATVGPPENVKAVTCDAGRIIWDVASEAEISDFSCRLDEFGVDQALVFSMDLKNVSETARRYRVNIFLEDEDRAIGHLVPRKGSPPVVKPGEAEHVEIPFLKLDAMPAKVHVMVGAMGG
ncbi:MAG: hypothetical protein ACLFUP_06810 [Desulfobacteraceae bacterium]